MSLSTGAPGVEVVPLDEQAQAAPPTERAEGRARAARGLWLGTTAWLLALAGTALLGVEAVRGWGVVLIVAAGALAVTAWGGTTLPPVFAPAAGGVTLVWEPRRVLALVGMGLSGLCVYLGSAAFLSSPQATFGAAGWLWLAGIALLIASSAAWPRSPGESAPAASPPWPAWEKALFAGLVALALGLRLWDLGGFPFNIYGDEIVTARVAIDSYIAQPGPSVFSLLWESVNLPGLWFLTVARSLELGGQSLWALRLPAALFGAATAVPFYGFMRLGWGRTAAIVGTAVLAFSAVHVHYSRLGLNNILTPFFWTASFFFLLRGLRTRRPVYWAAAGLMGGLSEYGYYGTRLLPFILAAFFVYLLIANRQNAARYLGRVALAGLGYLVGFGPLLAHYRLDPGMYTGRAADSLVWNRIPASWDDLQRMWATLWPIMSENLLGVSTHPSQDVIYYAPLLLPAEAALAALGVALLIRRCWHHPASFLTLTAGVGVLITGGTLVMYGEPPFFAHWTPAFWAFYAAVAVPVSAWAADVRAFAAGRLRWVGPGVVGAGLALLCWLNVSFYFGSYYANPDILKIEGYRTAEQGLELRSAQARYQASLGPRYVVLILGSPEHLGNPDTPFLVKGQDYRPVPDPRSDLPADRPPGNGLAFIFMPGGEQHRALVKSLYPGGVEGEVRSRTGRHLFYTYLLEP